MPVVVGAMHVLVVSVVVIDLGVVQLAVGVAVGVRMRVGVLVRMAVRPWLWPCSSLRSDIPVLRKR